MISKGESHEASNKHLYQPYRLHRNDKLDDFLHLRLQRRSAETRIRWGDHVKSLEKYETRCNFSAARPPELDLEQKKQFEQGVSDTQVQWNQS